MTVPREAVEHTRGALVGPLALFTTTRVVKGEHYEPHFYSFFIPPRRTDYVISVGGAKVDFASGRACSVFCKPAGQPSRGNRDGLCDQVLVAGAEASFIESLFREIFDRERLDIRPALNPLEAGVEHDIHRALDALPADDTERLKTIECLAPLIVIGLLKSALPDLASSSSCLRYRHPGIDRARNLMLRNYREPLTVADLAAKACLSRSQFIAAFKKQLGISPHDYLRRLRVDEARRLLGKGRGVSETGFEVGFASLSGFEEAFRKLSGISPSQYLKRSRT